MRAAERGYVAAEMPIVEVRWGGTVRRLRHREAALVAALLAGLDAIGDRPLGELRLSFSPHRVTASLSVPVRSAPGTEASE